MGLMISWTLQKKISESEKTTVQYEIQVQVI